MTMLAHNAEGANRSGSFGRECDGRSMEAPLEVGAPATTERREVQAEGARHLSILEEVAERWANEEGVTHLSAERASSMAGLLEV